MTLFMANKKIIESILACDLDNNAGSWYKIPIIPASASYSSESEREASRRLKKTKISFKISRDLNYIRRNLSLLVTFDDGTHDLIGTSDIPAHVTVNKSDTISCSCTWKMPEQ